MEKSFTKKIKKNDKKKETKESLILNKVPQEKK